MKKIFALTLVAAVAAFVTFSAFEGGTEAPAIPQDQLATIEKTVEENLTAFRAEKTKECADKIMAAATMAADSIMTAKKGGTLGAKTTTKPTKPTTTKPTTTTTTTHTTTTTTTTPAPTPTTKPADQVRGGATGTATTDQKDRTGATSTGSTTGKPAGDQKTRGGAVKTGGH